MDDCFPSIERGRAFIRQSQRQVQLQREQVTLYATWGKMRRERQRNRTMSAIAACVQDNLADMHAGKKKEPYLLICCRSMNLVIGNLRVLPLRRDGGGVQWNGGWWTASNYTATEENIRSNVEEWLVRDL